MKLPDWLKPAIWGIVGGAIAAIIVGFAWGGWVTGGTATDMQQASATSATVQALTPLCVTKGEQEPEMLVALNEESRWQQDDFVIEAGWVDNVREEYRTDVARTCATVLVEGMETD